jgi:hypothetical protein
MQVDPLPCLTRYVIRHSIYIIIMDPSLTEGFARQVECIGPTLAKDIRCLSFSVMSPIELEAGRKPPTRPKKRRVKYTSSVSIACAECRRYVLYCF